MSYQEAFKDAENEDAQEAEVQRRVNSVLGGNQYLGGPLETGVRRGALEASNLYGTNSRELGGNIRDLSGRLKTNMDQADPISEAIRNQRAGTVSRVQSQLRSAGVKGGAAANAALQAGRTSDMDIATSMYGQNRQSTQDYRSLLGNIASNTQAMQMGYGGLATGSEVAPTSNGLGTVICTELYNQGYYSDTIYKADQEYGVELIRSSFETYVGYRMWADYVVKGMIASPKFTKLIAFIAVPWARNMAGNKNIVGQLAHSIGYPICTILGKIKLAIYRRKHHVPYRSF